MQPWRAAIHAPTNAPPSAEIDGTPPAEHLELRWAYGFRGFDTRRAALWAGGPAGAPRIVYPAAAVVVSYDPVAHAQTFFTKHTVPQPLTLTLTPRPHPHPLPAVALALSPTPTLSLDRLHEVELGPSSPPAQDDVLGVAVHRGRGLVASSQKSYREGSKTRQPTACNHHA